MNLSCYLVDDEYHALHVLENFVRRTPGLALAGSSEDPLTALAALSHGQAPDIVFLDIDMPGLSGLELARLLPHATAVIFTTSYRDYGPEAFERSAVDYLLKPIMYERFLASIRRVRERRGPGAGDDSFFVRAGERGALARVPVGEVRYISGLSNYIQIHLGDRRITTHMPLQEIGELLPPDRFSRIHRSVIVAHPYISAVETDLVRLRDGTELTIGRTYRDAFWEAIAPALRPASARAQKPSR